MKNKTKNLLIALLLTLSGCGGVPYSSGDTAALVLYVGGAYADFRTTEMVLNEGGRESNPLIGENPSDGEIALLQLGGLGIAYTLGEIWPEHRKEIYIIGSFLHFGAAIHNYSEYRN